MLLDANAVIEKVYRNEWGRIVATLIRLFGGDFDLAEEVAQEAFAAAVDQWRESGIPEFPRAWIIQAARHKAIDRIRRRTRFAEKLEQITASEVSSSTQPDLDATDIPDDRLRLIFTCCHPALAPEAQVALTLRTLCGLETDEIARAFLVPVPTMAERIDAVLTVIYLVFNEGYAATRGEPLMRTDLCGEAIRLARLVCSLMGT